MKINFKTCEMWDDTKGWVTIETQENFDRLFNDNQSQGLVWFLDAKRQNWVNIHGYELTDKRYKWVGSFTQGFAWFFDNGYNWVNINGYELNEKRYDDVGNFIQGFATFSDDKGQGYCNTFGFEFRSVNFTWGRRTCAECFEDNKLILFDREKTLLPDFPRGSMKYYILTKVLT